MQREEPKKTKITVREDWPTSIASEAYGANVGCLAFNLTYIVLRDPMVAVELMEIYELARSLLDKPVLDKNNPEFEKANRYIEELYANSN